MLERMISSSAASVDGRSKADGPGKPEKAERAGLRWWMALDAGILWRLPLLIVLFILMVVFAFHGLVHLAFLFTAHPIGTFLFAPALLPFAFLPAGCFLFGIRFMPRVWRRGAYSPGQRVAFTGLGPLVAFVVALVINQVQFNLVRLMGIPLPRLPFDAT
jgi:hypothetical protein